MISSTLLPAATPRGPDSSVNGVALVHAVAVVLLFLRCGGSVLALADIDAVIPSRVTLSRLARAGIELQSHLTASNDDAWRQI
jgi:hypothetical protein